jgi:REP element-mobilizing transposase RayT
VEAMMERTRTVRFIRRSLPHWLVADAPFFVTFRLHGSIPLVVMKELAAEREQLLGVMSESDPRWLDVDRRRFRRIESILDGPPGGHAYLAVPEVGGLVFKNLEWLEGSRGWWVLSAVVMPTHMHMLIRNTLGRTGDLLEDLAQFKGFTGRKANAILHRTGSFWAREDFDHWCRNADKVESVARYIRNNPVKAGLVKRWQDWPWTRVDNAAFRALDR